jgi:hypothetical protein
MEAIEADHQSIKARLGSTGFFAGIRIQRRRDLR